MNPTAIFLIVATAGQYNYDNHMFSLQTNSSSFELINDSGFFPSIQDNYVVRNIGRSTVKAELWYGDELQWFGVVCGATIEPGDSKTLDNGGKLYYYTGLKILNENHERAIFHADGGDVYSPYAPGNNFDMFKYLRKTYSLSVKYIPTKSSGIFVDLISAFWPNKHVDIWTEILFQIKPLLGPESIKTLENSINTYLNIYKDKFINLTDGATGTFMSLVTEIQDVEEKFVFPIEANKLLNGYILPIYSNIISMKLHFYILGIRYKEKLGLSDNDVQNVLENSYRTYDNACGHISQLATIVDYAYNNSEAPNIFNNMMTIRTHLAIHGLEYMPIWKYKIDNPLQTIQIYNPVISYSTFVGKPTVSLYAQSTPVVVPVPLNPSPDGITTKNLTGMTVFLWCKDPSSLKIGGIQISFDNDEVFMMGTKTEIKEHVDLEGVQILQISVYGEGKIDGLAFYLSNGKIKSFGNMNTSSEDFKLVDHYISSFYLSSDDRELDGQAANLAVAYQWYIN